MSVFTDKEREYLAAQRLGRIATVGPDGQPHVVPTSFHYNAEHDEIDVGGLRMSQPTRIISFGIDSGDRTAGARSVGTG